MEINKEYQKLLIENSDLSKKGVSNSPEYRTLQNKLLSFEKKLTAKEIIFHAETTFPYVGLPQ